MSDKINLDELNKSGDHSRKFASVADNDFSPVGDIITEALGRLGGPKDNIFKERDVGKLLRNIHSELGEEFLDLREASSLCTKITKLKRTDVNKDTKLKDLNISLLLTHADYLGPIFYHRGMALVAWGKYKEAMVDLEQALRFNFTGRDLYKLHHKLAQCYQKLKKYHKAAEALQKAVDTIKSAKLNDKQKKEQTRILKEAIEKISNKKDADKDTKRQQTTVFSPHARDPSLSSLLAFKADSTRGRYTEAGQNISVGTVLAVERGLSPFLNPDDRDKVMKFCLVCMRSVGSLPFPCLTCARVVFCSPDCEARGAAVHRQLCALEVYNIRQKDTKDWCRIFSSLTVLLSRPLGFWLTNHKQLLDRREEGESLELPKLVNTELDRMEQLFSMVTHDEDLEAGVWAKHAVVTVFLLRSLRMTDYVASSRKNNRSREFSEEELILGRLIHRIRLISESNCYPLWGVEDEGSGQVAIENIGSGIYPGVGSCLNSDCNPNTIRVNRGNEVIIIASRNIKAGEEVSDNYCIHFSELPSEDRCPWLSSNFMFRCSCRACEEDWPVFDRLARDIPGDVKQDLIMMEQRNEMALKNGDIESALVCHQEEICLIQKQIAEPHQLHVTMRNSFQYCWWNKVALELEQ